MSSPAQRSISRLTASLIAVGVVFGLAVLMILKRYDPTVITTVVTGTSLAAAELVRRFQVPPSSTPEPERISQPGRPTKPGPTPESPS